MEYKYKIGDIVRLKKRNNIDEPVQSEMRAINHIATIKEHYVHPRLLDYEFVYVMEEIGYKWCNNEIECLMGTVRPILSRFEIMDL